jgi:hypothetical protein
MEIRLTPHEKWRENHVGTLNGLVGTPKNLDPGFSQKLARELHQRNN